MLRLVSVLQLEDFEVWRRRGSGLMILAALLVAAYWALWFADRGVVASAHTATYIAFEQSFPLADAWLAAAALIAAVQLRRRRPSALMWTMIFGGAGIYLCAMDVLYDLQRGIYDHGGSGIVELAINLATLAVSLGGIAVGWRFRHAVLDNAH